MSKQAVAVQAGNDDYFVKDIGLADYGRREIELAEQRIAAHPASRRPVHVDVAGLFHGQLVGVCVQVAESAARSC